MKKTTLSKELKEFCETKNLTLKELSEKTGVSITTLGNIINGKNTNPGIVTFLRICLALDISPDDLLG